MSKKRKVIPQLLNNYQNQQCQSAVRHLIPLEVV
jgi:hypothetical protein